MYDGNLSRALRATKVGTRDEQCGNVGGTEGRLLKGIGSCACCGSRAAAAKARAAVTVARQIRARKHVSRRWPALPCRRHRHHFCCGTTAYAFAERRLAVVTGWVAIARSVPPTHPTFLEMLARFSLRRHRKANVYRAPGLLHDLRLFDEQRPTERRPYLTTRSYGSTKGPGSAHIGLGRARAAPMNLQVRTCKTGGDR